MRISSKLKNSQIVYQTNFSGGLNTSVPCENIAANELGACDNFEIPVGATILRTRPGVASVAASVPIEAPETFLPVTHAGETKFLISAGQKLYLISALGVSTEYDLNGAKVPTFAKWGEEPFILIASGDKLQSLDLSANPATIAEVDPGMLRAPFTRVTYPDVPVPYARSLEQAALPTRERIEAAIHSVVRA